MFDTEVIGAEIYKTTDAGKTWKKTHDTFINDAFYSYGYYFADITVDESNENSLYISAVPLLFQMMVENLLKLLIKTMCTLITTYVG